MLAISILSHADQALPGLLCGPISAGLEIHEIVQRVEQLHHSWINAFIVVTAVFRRSQRKVKTEINLTGNLVVCVVVVVVALTTFQNLCKCVS